MFQIVCDSFAILVICVINRILSSDKLKTFLFKKKIKKARQVHALIVSLL